MAEQGNMTAMQTIVSAGFGRSDAHARDLCADGHPRPRDS